MVVGPQQAGVKWTPSSPLLTSLLPEHHPRLVFTDKGRGHDGSPAVSGSARPGVAGGGGGGGGLGQVYSAGNGVS